MKVAVVGASGLVGGHLYRYLRHCGHEVIGTFHARPVAGMAAFDFSRPDDALFRGCDAAVICAAVSRLDRCVREEARAREINVTGTVRLIERLLDMQVTPVFISSDRVFDGRRGHYDEDEMATPNTVYGGMKREVEVFLQSQGQDWLIFRLSKVYDRTGRETGLYQDIVHALQAGREVAAAFNQIFNPTHVTLICRAVEQALVRRLRGLYHLADRRVLSRYEFACVLAREVGADVGLVRPVDIATLPIVENRPGNTSLKVTRLERCLGMTLQ